jgi:polyhydroxybutyrate depolymerase
MYTNNGDQAQRSGRNSWAAGRLVKLGSVALLTFAFAWGWASGVRATCLTSTLTPGTFTFSFSFGGQTRSYDVYVPATYVRTSPMPLVIDMHGYTSSKESQQGVSGFRQKADQAGFIVAWPQGTGNSWNGYGCCGSAQGSVDDVGFIRAVVNDISVRANVDHSRVYATGISNGGVMSHRLACEAADVFAAVAPVSFPLNISASSCTPVRPITVVHFHGLSDDTVPYNGGGLIGAQSAANSFNARKTVAQCTGSPVVVDLGSGQSCQTYTSCAQGAHISLCSLNGEHVLYNTQSTLNIANHAWDNELSHHTNNSLPDQDHDGVPDQDDNCPAMENPDQADDDDDCTGDVCEGVAPPPGSCASAGTTAWFAPASNAADSGGDGNGFESTPSNAYNDTTTWAVNNNGDGDRHRFSDFNLAIPSGCVVKGVEARIDWKLDSTLYTSSMGVEVSTDGGTTFSAKKSDTSETTSEHSKTLGSSTDLWGISWGGAGEGLSNGNFRLRITSTSSYSFRDFSLEYVAVRVSYGP